MSVILVGSKAKVVRMYRKLERSTGKALGYFIEGSMSKDEIDAMHREIEPSIRLYGKIRMLLQIGDLSIPEPGAVWKDLKLTPEYLSDVERYAVVGDKKWHEHAAGLTDFLAKGEARFFEHAQLDDAWNWIMP
jgi:hypothetical protein